MSIKQTILIIEDEMNIASFMKTILTANEYNVLIAKDGTSALMIITSHCPDMIILDLGLPDMDGLTVIRAVREWSQIPILVVSARTHEKDKVTALDLGADDYVTKPFGTSELLARVRTALRHVHNRCRNQSTEQICKFTAQGLMINYDQRHVYVDGQDIHLTQNEYKIVALLANFAGKVLTYEMIIQSIWGPNGGCDNQILRVNMANIRRKMEKNPGEPKYIFTETGVGYRMIEGD